MGQDSSLAQSGRSCGGRSETAISSASVDVEDDPVEEDEGEVEEEDSDMVSDAGGCLEGAESGRGDGG